MEQKQKIAYRDLGSNGRLGNSLFQIAATIGIADSLGADAVFPEWKYAKYFEGPMDLGLDPETVTHIYEDPAFHYTEFDISQIIGFKPGNEDSTQVINLQGYFQSEKYWAHCKQKVWDTLKFNTDTIEKTLDHLRKFASIQEMGSKKFVSVHFRFGDYRDNPYYTNLVGTDYYKTAIEHIIKSEDMNQTLFLIFSDEPESAKKAMQNLNLSGSEDMQYRIVSGLKEIHDLCLQSVCHINICANSSFSWWGAYLNREVDNKIIMPGRWFAGNGLSNDTKDLYPKNALII